MLLRLERAALLTTLLLLIAGAAEAHVTVDPKTAKAGGYTKLTFRIGHGCDGSATKRIKVDIPAGVESVKPKVHPGWQIQIARAGEAVTAVTWEGGPLPDEYMDEFEVSVKMPAKKATLAFVVTQDCEKGSTSWSEPVTKGKEPDHPAPQVVLQ